MIPHTLPATLVIGFVMDHIVIYAGDIGASAAFYDAVLGRLGFEKRRDHVYARAGFFFDIRAARDSGPVYQPGRPGIDHLGFAAGSRQQVKTMQAELAAADIGPTRLIHFENGDLALFATSPEGLRLEITCYADPDSEPVD